MRDAREWIQTDKGYYPANKAIVIKANRDTEVVAFLRDAEVDGFKATFDLDGNVKIDTKQLAYVLLDEGFLKLMKKLIRQASDIHDELRRHMDENYEYRPPESMITEPIQDKDLDIVMERMNRVLGLSPVRVEDPVDAVHHEEGPVDPATP